MAQITLDIQVQTNSVKTAVKSIEGEFSNLSKHLSSLTVNKDLTSQLKALASAYKQIAVAGKGATETLSGQAASADRAVSNIDTLRKGYANLANQLKTLKEQYPAGVFTKADQQIQKNLKSVKALSKAYKSGNWGDAERKEVRTLSEEYKSLAADVAQVRFEENKLATSEPFSPKQGDSIFRLQKRYSSLISTIKSVEQYYPKGTFDQITAGAQEAVPALKKLGQEYVTTGTLSDNSQKKFNALTTQIHQQEAAFKDLQATSKNYHGTLRDLIAGFAKFQLTAMLVMQPLNLLRNALQSINETLVETEDAVLSIQRVLDETIMSDDISDEIYRIAQNLGQTFDVVQEIAQNFAKAGLDWRETIQATEAAVLALNVAELTAEESSEGLIAIMQQFNYEASELTYVIDVLNKTADKSAVNTQELLVALQKTGSYATTANLSLEETVALITAISEATAASGQNIGNALKSLFAYTTKDSALDIFAALSTDSSKVVEEYRKGAASILDVWKQVSVELQNLTAEQGELLDQYFDSAEGSALEEELGGELSEIYDDIKGVYDTAGTYRKNYFLALLGNMEEVENVLNEVSDAAGYTMTEQEKYMETYTAKVNVLRSQWEALIADQQGWLSVKKFFVDVGSAILTVVEWTGGLRTTLIAIVSLLTTVFSDKIISGAKALVGWVKNLATGFTAAKTAAQTFQAALGWMGLAATVISGIVGAIQQYNEEQEQAHKDAIALWNANKSNAESLQELYDRYKQLQTVTEPTTEQENEYAELQEQIVDLLGDRKAALEDLTVGTDEYRIALENLTEAELERYEMELTTAQRSAEKLLGDANFGKIKVGSTLSQKYLDLIQDAGIGVDVSYNFPIIPGAAADYTYYLQFDKSGTAEGNLFNMAQALQAQEALWEEYKKLQREGDFDAADSIIDSDLWQNLTKVIEENQEAVDDFLETTVAQTLLDYEALYGEINNEAEHEQMTNWVIEQIGVDEYWDETIRDLIGSYKELGEASEDTNDSAEDLATTIDKLSEDNLDALIEALKEARDLADETKELEEKQQAIIDAQTELEEKRNELVAARAEAAEKIADAEEKLAEAQKKVNEERLALLDQQKEAQEAIADAEENLADAEEKLADAQKKVNEERLALLDQQKEAQEAIADAEENLADAEDELLEKQNDLAEAQAEAAERLADAQESLADAQKSLNEERLALLDEQKEAEEALANAQQEAEEARLDILEKQNAVLEAQNALRDARNRREVRQLNAETGEFNFVADQAAISEAEQELADAQEAKQEAQERYEETLQAVRDAESELADINATIADAERAIEEAIAAGVDISREILAEEKNVATGVRDAIEAVKEAQQNISDVEEENRENIANAEQAIEEAKENVDEAKEELQEANNNLSAINDAIARAEEAVKEAIQNGVDISAEIQETEEKIEQGVLDAIDAVVDAEEAVDEAKEEAAEMIANAEQAIVDAEAAVEEAIKELEDYIRDNAYDGIIEELESGNATNESIKEILDSWKTTADENSVGSAWYQEILDILKGFNVDVTTTGTETKPEDPSDAPKETLRERLDKAAEAKRKGDDAPMNALLEEAGLSLTDNIRKLIALYLQENKEPLISALEKTGKFDNGGVAYGTGLLAKATSRPEAVLPPDIVEKILTPTSNRQLSQFIRDMGLMFDTAKDFSVLSPAIQRVGATSNTTTNTNSNNTVTINGVKIGSSLMNRTLGEVLEMIPFVAKS